MPSGLTNAISPLDPTISLTPNYKLMEKSDMSMIFVVIPHGKDTSKIFVVLFKHSI